MIRKHMTRRQLAALLVATPLAVAGCSEIQSVIGATPQFVTDITTIATDFVGALPSLASIAGVSQTVVDTVTGYVNQAKAVAAQIGAAAGQGVAGLVANFSAIVTQIAGVAGVNISGAWGTILQAAIDLLPSILAAAGVALAPRAAVAHVYSPDQARAILVAFQTR